MIVFAVRGFGAFLLLIFCICFFPVILGVWGLVEFVQILNDPRGKKVEKSQVKRYDGFNPRAGRSFRSERPYTR